jgi:RimJ/RimL family protein N-acetyltransferase
VTTPRLRLERLGVERARSLLAGDLSVVDAAPGWPHDDTLDAVRMSAEHAGADADGVVEIGYGLAAPFRGRGLGTELVALLTAWVLEQPGVRRVSAEVLVGNEPSLRALTRNGYEVDRVEAPYVHLSLGAADRR